MPVSCKHPDPCHTDEVNFRVGEEARIRLHAEINGARESDRKGAHVHTRHMAGGGGGGERERGRERTVYETDGECWQ